MKKALSTLLATGLGMALLVYSGLRSVDFITATLPPDKQILAWFALAATEGGIMAWLLYFLFAAAGGWQRAIAVVMLVVDFLGSVALFTADTLLRSGEAGMIASLTSNEIRAIILAMSGVIALNTAATVACHIFDPANRKRMAAEEAQDAIEDAAIKRISGDADNLAAELAPHLAGDWMMATRNRYLSSLGSGRALLPSPGDKDTVELSKAISALQNIFSNNGHGERVYQAEAEAVTVADPKNESVGAAPTVDLGRVTK